MRVLVVVAFILIAVLGSVFCGEAEWVENRKQCLEINNIKQEQDVKDAVHGRTPEADVTQNVKCFFLCLAEKQKYIKDGVFQPQVFIDALSGDHDKDLVTKAAAECNVKGKDDCDTGFKLATCIKKNNMHKRA